MPFMKLYMLTLSKIINFSEAPGVMRGVNEIMLKNLAKQEVNKYRLAGNTAAME